MGLPARLHYILWRHETWRRALNRVTDVFDLFPFSALTIPIAGHEGRWVVAVALTVAFTLLARVVRGVTNSGAVAGAFSCFVLYVGGGPGAFAALITVFALAWITTRLGLCAQAEVGDGGTPRGQEGIPGAGQSRRCYSLCRGFHRQS